MHGVDHSSGLLKAGDALTLDMKSTVPRCFQTQVAHIAPVTNPETATARPGMRRIGFGFEK